jgi:choline dehydrogenase-like flavoprotein
LDNWGRLGNEGWSWDDILPYYQKAETFHEPTGAARQAHHVEAQYLNASMRGTDGPIQTSLPEGDFIAKAWTETCKNARLRENLQDPRAGSAIGGFNQLSTIDPKTGQRSYATNAYLLPHMNRPNLFILTEAFVERIILEQFSSGYRASAVQFSSGGKSERVLAKREVILCGGAFGSPQILEHSGLGSSTILQGHGIDVIVENCNIGENLQDHVIARTEFDLVDPQPTKAPWTTVANLSLNDITNNEDHEDYLGVRDECENGRQAQYQLLRDSFSDANQPVATLLALETSEYRYLDNPSCMYQLLN